MHFRTVLLILSFVAASVALGSRPARVAAESPAPAENEGDLIDRLANLAPVLDSRQGATRSFELRWHVWDENVGYLRVRCAYATPDQRACTVMHDEVPLFVAVGQDIFVYGPLNGPRLLRGDWQVSNSDFQGRTGDIAVGWKILSPGSSEAGILLDLRSLVTRADRDRRVTHLGENRFLLTGRTAGGGALEARIDLSSPARYSRLTARSADGTGRLELETLAVDEHIRPGLFRFPNFQGKLNLAPATPVRLDNIGEIMQQVMVSSFLRVPMMNPRTRKEWEERMAQPPDWQRLEAQDAALAPILKEIVKGIGQP